MATLHLQVSYPLSPPSNLFSTYQALVDDVLDHRLNRVTVQMDGKNGQGKRPKTYDLDTENVRVVVSDTAEGCRFMGQEATSPGSLCLSFPRCRLPVAVVRIRSFVASRALLSRKRSKLMDQSWLPSRRR